ncbi:MAG: hypothetical protein BHV63_07730 [Alistipes sp. 56_11]|nr:MAG: hypothetical protein BHV63_07730 [Alistipes sp. 56_11]
MKRVALVLSSGGARGFAHIGAIEELQERGYEIASVAGTSMGALIGGMFAAGKLEQVKERAFALDRKRMLALADISMGPDHLVKGEKVMGILREIMPDIPIETLPVPFCAVATDLADNSEVVYDSGSLYEAIRASISIPAFFKPQRNALNRVTRSDGDLLVSVNVSAHSDMRLEHLRETRKRNRTSAGRLPALGRLPDENFYSVLSKTFVMMLQRNAELTAQLYPPDIRVDIPMNRFGGFDYDKAARISSEGRRRMREALELYEKTHNIHSSSSPA